MPDWVRTEHFERPLVKAVMTPIGNPAEHPGNITPQQERASRPWMDETMAMDVIFRGGIEKVFAELKFRDSAPATRV